MSDKCNKRWKSLFEENMATLTKIGKCAVAKMTTGCDRKCRDCELYADDMRVAEAIDVAQDALEQMNKMWEYCYAWSKERYHLLKQMEELKTAWSEPFCVLKKNQDVKRDKESDGNGKDDDGSVSEFNPKIEGK